MDKRMFVYEMRNRINTYNEFREKSIFEQSEYTKEQGMSKIYDNNKDR